MGEIQEEKGYADGEEDGFTQYGTVDLKGRPVLRSDTGGWKACTFLVGMERFFFSLLILLMNSLILCFDFISVSFLQDMRYLKECHIMELRRTW